MDHAARPLVRAGGRGERVSAAALAALAPYLRDCRSILDVGAGPGTLAIPLARRGWRVTALEPAPAMLAHLRRAVRREGVAGVRCLPTTWENARPGRHDMVLVASVPEVLRDLPAFVGRAAGLARRWVVVVQSAGAGPDKFSFDELYPLLFQRPYERQDRHRDARRALRALGVSPRVRIIRYRFDQPVRDLNEAVAFWRAYLPPLRPDQVAALRRFLRRRLRSAPGGCLAPIQKTSAVLAWRPRGIWTVTPAPRRPPTAPRRSERDPGPKAEADRCARDRKDAGAGGGGPLRSGLRGRAGRRRGQG